MKNLLLGIDIGTSACKVALFSPDGRAVAQASESYSVQYPAPGFAEQDPQIWWTAVCTALKRILADSGINPCRIAGIGVDGQSWSAIAVDAKGDVLCPTPIWMDTRAGDIVRSLRASFGDEAFFSRSRNPLFPAYSLPKILWYQRHRPDLFRKTRYILQSNSFIVYRLTNAITQDISQGYGHACFSMKSGKWDRDFAVSLGFDPEILPEIYACHEVVGQVSEAAARQTGLLAGTPVVAGGLDAACGTLGVGAIHAGETQEQGGQAGGMSICLDQYAADPRLILSFHVVPNRWLLQGGTVGGGGVIRWFEQEFCAEERQHAADQGTGVFEEMSTLAGRVAPGSEGLIMLPYMAGERSPIWNEQAKGVYFGIDYGKTRAHFIRSGMEGVAYALRHNLEIAEAAGAKVGELRAMGGAANSAVWTQIKSDITQKTITIPATDTATTLGAAMLAGVGVGLYRDFDQAITETVRFDRSHCPNAQNAPTYDEGYRKYRLIYERLKDLMDEKEDVR